MSQPPPNSQPTTPYPYGAYQNTTATTYTTPGYSAYPAAGAYPAPTGQPGAYQTTAWPYPYGYYPAQSNPSTSNTGTMTPRPPTAYPSNSMVQRSSTPVVTTAPVAKASSFQQYNPATASSAYTRDTSAAPAGGTGGGAGRGRNKTSFKGLFTKELRNLMYGFGDDRNPTNDTVSVMEEILVEYIVDVCQTAAGGRKTRISIEDLRKALGRSADAKKLARMEELLFMQEDIKRARAQYTDEPEMDARNYS